MRNVTVKNVPDDLYERLKKVARANRRSLNSEIIVCMEKAVRSHRVDRDEVLATARALREKTVAYRLTDEELREARNEGRP